MKTVFLFITEGVRIRNVLYSDVLRLLREQCRVVLFVPPPDVKLIAQEFGGGNVVVEPIPESPTKWESNFVFVRRYLLSNPARNRTASVFSSVMKKDQPFHYALIRYVNPWLGRSRLVRNLWLKGEALINRGQEYADLFERYRPELVISTDYGAQRQEIRILRQAHHRGVKTASIVFSWDNLSSKGVMGCRPQKLMVWNEIMRTEAEELHDIPKADVSACGAAHFDIYAQKDSLLSRAEFCQKMRLDPARPIIVQGTITPKYFSGNYDILDLLVKSVESGRLPGNPQILVRLHPQTVNKGGAYADELQPYLDYEKRHPFVRVDHPQTVCWGSLVSPARDDAKHLAEILHHAAVIIHPGSTLVVDASAMDCPAIGLGFDGYTEKPYDESIRRWWDYTYMEPIIRSGGQPVARNAEELVELTAKAILDRNHLAAGRAKIRDWICHRLDGNSGRRIVETLMAQLAN